MDVDLLSRYFLAIYFLVIGVHYTSVALGRLQRTGQSHINAGRTGTKPWIVRQTFNFFRTAILVLCVSRLLLPTDSYLGRFDSLYQLPVVLTGIVLMLASLSIVSYVHSYMGSEWRSGVADGATQLLTEGPYKHSRNPMFIGIMLGQLGFFFSLPSLFTLICFIAGATAIISQAKHEENALKALYGGPYEQYKQQVSRWL